MSRPEVWKPIPGFERYEASTRGRVRSFAKIGCLGGQRQAKPRILVQTLNDNGYLRVVLRSGDGTRQPHRVNRLVLLALVGPPPTPEHQGSHLNGNKTDNRLDNLCWENREQNNVRATHHNAKP